MSPSHVQHPTEPDPPDIATRLARCYSALVRGLDFPGSESSPTPFEPFAAPFDSASELTADAFRAAARLRAAWWKLDLEDADARLEQLFSAYREYGEAASVVALDVLRRTMLATLEPPLRTARAGPDHVLWSFHKTRHYLFGRVPGGGLAGVVAFSVET